MKYLKVRLTLTEEALGMMPTDKEIHETYIASNAPDAPSIEEEVAAGAAASAGGSLVCPCAEANASAATVAARTSLFFMGLYYTINYRTEDMIAQTLQKLIFPIAIGTILWYHIPRFEKPVRAWRSGSAVDC